MNDCTEAQAGDCCVRSVVRASAVRCPLSEYDPAANRLWLVIVAFFLTGILSTGRAEAVPAFARKYEVDCTVCHTRPPRLNTFGERFLENGYQMPGTQDGGLVKKIKLSNVTLDDVSNYFAVRLHGNFLRNFDATADEADRTELAFPEVLNIFFAGTFTQNMGGFVEVESDFEEGETSAERGILTINNLASSWLGMNTVHFRAGKLDPSAYFSYPTHRQQIIPVAGEMSMGDSFTPLTMDRMPLGVPHAFSTKFFGLFDSDGQGVPVLKPVLYDAIAAVGADIHGRPFGDWFLYQVGVLNSGVEEFGDSNDQKDYYVMGRFDYARSKMVSANVSGFAYFGNDTAKVQTGDFVDWNRYGVATTVRWRMIDVYGAFVWDKINNLPDTLKGTFDDTASGFTLEADTLLTSKLLASARYDHLDAGGAKMMREDASFLSTQLKYYHRDNMGFFVRGDINLRGDSDHPLRSLRSAAFAGLDIAF